MTNVYHITKFPDYSAYLFFYGCNWDCEFCILKKSRYDIHSEKIDFKGINFLEISDIIKILNDNKIKEVFLGGGEPTLDRELIDLIKLLKNLGIKINLLTNGELLTYEIVELSDRISFSIKTLDREKHIKITKRDNTKSLENLKRLVNEKFTFETVYSENMLGCDNSYEISKFISGLIENPVLRIDMMIEVSPNFPRPSEKSVDKCIEKINNELNVRAFRIKSSEKNAIQIYP
ncbi:MAG: radical SAM protein [Thermoplasmata archaeon]